MLCSLKRIQQNICPELEAEEEFTWVSRQLDLLGLGKSLCHNDFYANNILVQQGTWQIRENSQPLLRKNMLAKIFFIYFSTSCRLHLIQVKAYVWGKLVGAELFKDHPFIKINLARVNKPCYLSDFWSFSKQCQLFYLHTLAFVILVLILLF